CNLTCAHCRRLESNETADKDLGTPEAKNLLEQLSVIGQKQHFMPIVVFSGGEPLCRSDIFDLIEYARSLSITPALATNGTLVDAAIAKRIKDSGVARVSISIDGATAQVHDQLRQLKGSFELSIAGMKHLAAQQVPFQINTTLTRNNAEQMTQMYELAQSLGAVAFHIFVLVPVGCGQALAETDMLSPQAYERIMTEIYGLEQRAGLEIKVTCGPHYERIRRQQPLFEKKNDVSEQKTDRPMPHKHHGASRGCLAGMGVLFVGHQGDVFPCGYLPINCGNILQKPLAEIWYGSGDLAKMRDSGCLEGKCGVCGYRNVCGGCRGRAYAATGNYMASEPFCSYIPPHTETDKVI
ncbi:MAG: radical SAM protein, partial [Sedimentisphaerales bacterium]|nr:radical SAM protein [Sedimentisphaerales bacterium]